MEIEIDVVDPGIVAGKNKAVIEVFADGRSVGNAEIGQVTNLEVSSDTHSVFIKVKAGLITRKSNTLVIEGSATESKKIRAEYSKLWGKYNLKTED